MSELKAVHAFDVYEAYTKTGDDDAAQVYIKSEADKVIAGLKARTAELEALNHDLCERVTENDEIRLHWEEIEQTRAENERMKARIAELEEERRWRKFPDEKPEEDTWCIVFHDGEIDSDHYTRFAYNNKCDFALYGNEVTHWMPLPSAPKEEK